MFTKLASQQCKCVIAHQTESNEELGGRSFDQRHHHHHHHHHTQYYHTQYYHTQHHYHHHHHQHQTSIKCIVVLCNVQNLSD